MWAWSCCVVPLYPVVLQAGCRRRQPRRMKLVSRPRLKLHVCHHCKLRVTTFWEPARACWCELQQDLDWQSWQGRAQSVARINLLH